MRVRILIITVSLIAVAIASWRMLADPGTERRDEPPIPEFVDVTAVSGIDHRYEGGFTHFVGGGVAVFDCDQNRLPDLFFAGGAGAPALYRNISHLGGELRFASTTDPLVDGMSGVTGAYPIDVDDDGLTDLAVLRVGENMLLRGVGDCRFERANETWNLDGGDAWTVGFSATWEDGSRRPTLAFGNYLALDQQGQQFGGCGDHMLFRPGGAGDTYDEPIVISPGYCSLSLLFSDWDRNLGSDLRITNDRHYYRQGEEQLFEMVDDRPPRPYTRDEGWQFVQIEGMGIASHDVTGDGVPEIFLTSMADNKLQQLAPDAGGPEYGDIAFELGATAHRPFVGSDVSPSTAWHPEFQDVNNDGIIDLFISKGNVDETAGFAVDDPNNLLLGQPDGGFIEHAEEAGIVDFGRSRGAALVDLNLDGLLDLVYVNRQAPVRLWHNVGAGLGNWLAIDLEQSAPNIDAIGSWVEVKAGNRSQHRERTIGGGHAGGQLGWMHVGLGAAENAELRVQWPDGALSDWIEVDANGFVTIDRPGNDLRIWQPEAIAAANGRE